MAARATSGRLSRAWRGAAGRCDRRLDPVRQLDEPRGRGLAALCAIAQPVGCERVLVLRRRGAVVDFAERIAADHIMVGGSQSAGRMRGGSGVCLAERRIAALVAPQLGSAHHGIRHGALQFRAVCVVDLLGRARIRRDDDRGAPALAFRVARRRRLDGGCDPEAFPGRSLGRGHDSADRLVSQRGGAVAGDWISRAAPAAARPATGRGMKLANTVDSALRLTGVLALVLASASAALAAAPKMDDYARGAVIEAIGRPIVELALPDEAYQSVTSSDLRDVREFNADGEPVPHALCAARDSEEPTITEHPAPVFELRDVSGADGEGARIEVQTDGTRIDVHTGARGSTSRPERIHIIDARSIKRPLRAIRFDWSSADQASQAKVRIEASDDLDRWDTVVAGGALIRAST